MAIIFSKDLESNELLNSHNNNVVKFNSDNALAPIKCTIEVVGAASFDITPNPDGNFKYDFRDIIKAVINENNFKDTVTPDIESSGYVYTDDTLFKELSVNYKIELSGGSTENVSKTYLFIKSIKQPIKYNNQRIIAAKIAILLPLEEFSNRSYYLPYFEGYPIDIPIYSDIERTITLRNKTNGLESDFNLNKGINRIFISQGSQNFTIDEEIILASRINELEVIADDEEQVTILVEKIESKCAVYLKWYNDTGSYSGFRFHQIHEEGIKTKTSGELDYDFKDITESDGSNNIIGKTAQGSKSLEVKRITKEQLRYLYSIFTSPKIELYLEPAFGKQQTDSFLSVKITDKGYKAISNKRTFFNVKLEIVYNIKTLEL